ncbi:MAG: LLM class flavin-dependent oxidoreductase [Alphaproteobacteria bacterium]|nr:LLM class flavin-dependent oxidoreductase [Alphaproteobacteria bacterium]
MEFGVFDHLDLRPGADLAAIYEERLRLIAGYDAAGIATYHLAEHHATPLGLAPSPSVFLAAVAQRTTRLRFGPMVYCLPLYDPLRLIEEICMLDHMSGGRFEFGVGRGISPFEVAYFGIDKETAPAIYREAFEVLMRGFANAELTFQGEHFSYDSVPMVLTPVQRPHPPLWYGVGAPHGAQWPAEQGINIISNAPCPVAREATDRYRNVWHANHGNDDALPKMGAARHIYIGETDAEAEEVAARAYTAWYNNFMNLWRHFGADPQVYPSDFKEARDRDIIIAGSPDTAAAEIARQVEAAGLNYFVCRFAFGDLRYEESARSLALFADDVAPEFRRPT